ncbi:MAG: helix-turn-helix domain-containing protein [Victivallales bacterium]|nr:helix-turn-helix domain-containing protein [Victivallales bacterium]
MDSGNKKKSERPRENQGFLPLDFEARQQLDANEPPVPASDLIEQNIKLAQTEPETELAHAENISTNATPEPDSLLVADTDSTQKDFHIDHGSADDDATADAQEQKTAPVKPVPTAVKETISAEPISPAEAASTAEPDKPESPKLRKKHLEMLKLGAGTSIGRLLHEARLGCGLSIAEVEAETRISSAYIEALEHDDFKELPPAVYVRAYIRSLCGLYDIGSDVREDIQRGIKMGIEGIVSEEILQHLEKDKHVNVEDEQKIRRIFHIIIASAALLLVLLIAGIFYMIFGGSDKSETVDALKTPEAVQPAIPQPVPVNAFDPAKLDELSLPVQLDMSLLPPKKKTGTTP